MLRTIAPYFNLPRLCEVLRAEVSMSTDRASAARLPHVANSSPTPGVHAAALGVATLPLYDFFAPRHNVLLKQSRAFGVDEHHGHPLDCSRYPACIL
jgi:hypothetical protein